LAFAAGTLVGVASTINGYRALATKGYPSVVIYVAQERVCSSEPVSALLFSTARPGAADQHLFHAELKDIPHDVNRIERLAVEQFYDREAELRRAVTSAGNAERRRAASPRR
jgi:hypothetical protein